MSKNRQAEIYQYIQDFLESHGYAPSVREIAQAVGLRSPASVTYHLSQLQEQGLLQYEPGKKRAISLPLDAEPPAAQIPILGLVTAGLPILAVENQEGSLPWDGDPNCFALRVRGDSMVNAAILDGDLVVVRPQPTADDGQIIVALLGEEATVKRLRKKSGKLWLQPENPHYDPIYADNIQVLGLVKAVIRRY